MNWQSKLVLVPAGAVPVPVGTVPDIVPAGKLLLLVACIISLLVAASVISLFLLLPAPWHVIKSWRFW